MDRSRLLHHIKHVARCPSFSTYEERLHPYIRDIFDSLSGYEEIEAAGNNLIFRVGQNPTAKTIAIASHLDKINHYGEEYPKSLPVSISEDQITGAMDDSAGVGLALTLAEWAANSDKLNLLFFFSEMEESKGLKEHPELLKNNGRGYEHGLGARRISHCCKAQSLIPDEVITLDTTPLFKGKQGIALYSKHWELTDLNASQKLKEATAHIVKQFQDIYPDIQLHNNTNDYLHYGFEFNTESPKDVVSIALEPSIYPYHQKGEKVYKEDIFKLLSIMKRYLERKFS